MRAFRSAGALAPALLLACASRGPVTRIADGRTFEGRPIAPEAYAAYLRASVLEERGDARGAVSEFERALDEDPNSPEIVTRIACLVCASAASSRDADNEALGTFDDALALDPTYAPAWLGLAECRERGGDLRGALAAATWAVYYDASSPRATRTAARVSFALGRSAEGFTWLEALIALDPTSREAFEAYLDASVRQRDAAREARARRALDELGSTSERSRSAALDSALVHGELQRARSIAVELSVTPSALAWRALDVASAKLALEQAELALAADPSDSDAWLVALAAADELGERERFDETLRLLAGDPQSPTPRACAMLATLLARHVGSESAALLQLGNAK